MLGTTPAEINLRFPARISDNITAPGGARRLSHLTDREVSKLAFTYAYADGDVYHLVNIIQAHAPNQLARFLKAAHEVGTPPPATSPPFPLVRPRPIRPVGPRIRIAERQKLPSPPMPNVGMTLNEIYLEFRTAQIGSMGAQAALYETAMFVGTNLAKSSGFAGPAAMVASYLLQNYAPETMDALVGQNLTLLINGSHAIVLDSSTALLLVQDSSPYGLGDFGIIDDISLGPRLPWETPTPVPADPMTGWGPNSGFGFDTGSPTDRTGCSGKHGRKC